MYTGLRSSPLRKPFLGGIAAAICVLLSANAKADCPTTGLPARFVFTIAASSALAIGEVIPGATRSFRLSGRCTESRTFGIDVVACPGSTPPIPGTVGIYPTGMEGVGMRLRNSSGTSLTGTGSCSSPGSTLGTVGQDGTFDISGTFELVKTGPISGGTLTNSTAYRVGILGTGVLLNNGAGTAGGISAENTIVRSVACSISTGSATQTVTLPRISAQALTAAGSVAGRTPFQIDLNCQAGVNVKVLFEPSPAAAGTGSVLASTGTADGVGVQLLSASATPIQLNTPTQLTTSTTGNMSFRFLAEYRRLSAAAVTAGTISARTVFTMQYQ